MDGIGSLEISWIQGFTNKNIAFVDNKTICYPCGSHINFLNVETKTQSVLKSPGGGVGASTANGNSGIFAFSEQKVSPSIFVYNFPELLLKNELKGTTQLDYTSLTLSDSGSYLGSCSSPPDYAITVWNWESASQICVQQNAMEGVFSLLFNPLNWLQLCALKTTGLTVWTIEKSGSFHCLKPSEILLPATDGTFTECLVPTSHTVSDKVPYIDPEMPPSAISGLQGDKAESIVAKLCTKARLTPAAICWTAKSELFVGCAEGFLLLVEPESRCVSVLFNPTIADALPELKQNNFQGLTLDKNSLISVGKEGVVHCLKFKETQINVTQTWKIEDSVTTVINSPDNKTLVLSSKKGQIYTLNQTQMSHEIVKVLDVLSGNFVAAALSHTDRNICVSVRESGELQLWSTEGKCLGSLCLQAELTSLACCPVAQYAAVGTTAGSVLFIDLNSEQPCLVHEVHLYHTPVDQLLFDQEGNFLFTGSSDSHIFVLDPKPSKRFSVMGYAVVPGPILSLSAQTIRESKQVKVLALCVGQEGKSHNGRWLTVLSLPARDLSDFADKHGCLATILNVSTYEVPDPLECGVLGVSDIFAYCHKRKALQRFQLPQDTDGLSCQDMIQLNPAQEVRGHPLGPASLVLSPHSSWLASVGRDGLLRIWETVSMERYVELQCHSWRLGGVRSVSFSADSQTLVTTGFKDESLLCTNLRLTGLDAGQVNEASQYSKSLDRFLCSVFRGENPVLMDLPEWGKVSTPDADKPQESEATAEAESVDVTEQDESYNILLSAPPSHLTWLERKQEAVMKEENEQHSEVKKSMRKSLRDLRDTIQAMMRENETLNGSETLELQECNLDVEEQKRLEAMVEQEDIRVTNEIEQDMLAKRYLWDVLKKEFWDSLKVKGKAIKAFHSECKVKNYPLKERTVEEKEDLLAVQNMRKCEKAACTLQQSRLKKSSNTPVAKEEEQAEEGHRAESAAVTGSFSAQLGYSIPHIYDQFSLITTEQRVNQIILLQDVIYRIKSGFNADFEAAHRQKVQELNRVSVRNGQIRAIMLELDLKETLWEPSLTVSESPERLLIVDDSEIKAEKYPTPEQKEEEERKKLEEQRRLASKGTNLRDIALDDMMDGALEVKKENILKMEIPPPEFVLTKPSIQWTEEERKVFKHYEKKEKELSEEKEKYKKSLETEIKKLQAATKEATEKLDETLKQLFEKKLKCDISVCQEELKITYLVYSVLIEGEMRNRELELKLKLENTAAYKDEIVEKVKKHEEDAKLFQETYNNIVAEDKVLDKEFKKDFFNVPGHLVDQLYKLFKRRPRVQKMRTQTINNGNPSKEQRLCDTLAPDGLGKLLKAMEELDAPENMPEGLNRSVWDKFCAVRRTKVESEHKVKVNALILAEMQAFLQKRRDEEKSAQQEIKDLADEIERLHKEKSRFLTDIKVQVLLKPDRMEVSITDMAADYWDSLLCPKSVVEELIKSIRTQWKKIAAVLDTCKGSMLLQQEHRRLTTEINDLNNKKRDIHRSRLTKGQQDFFDNEEQDSRVSKQLSNLEKTTAFQEMTFLQSVQHLKNKTKQLNQQAVIKAKKTEAAEELLPDMQVAVAERTHIYEVMDSEENQTALEEECYQETVQRSRLEEFAKAQAEDLALLRAEVERLRMKNFPSLDQLKHN